MSSTITETTWNIWGHCERCDCWFERPADDDVPWTCPTCDLRPLHIQNRGPVTTPSRN